LHADTETIYNTRQQQAKPLLEQLKTYLDEKAKTSLPQSPVGKAIAYTLKRWPFLINYLEDGRYEIDNNRTERAIKPFVMGRKNWMFSNSVDGAHISARLFSLIETAKANQVNPFAYLTYIFKELPNCKDIADYEALLPYHLKDIFKITK
jgi:transposase